MSPPQSARNKYTSHLIVHSPISVYCSKEALSNVAKALICNVVQEPELSHPLKREFVYIQHGI